MVNLSTYLKSLLHLANQPGQFQIKGGAVFKIPYRTYTPFKILKLLFYYQKV